MGETEPGFLHYAPTLRAGAPVGMTAGISQRNPLRREMSARPAARRVKAGAGIVHVLDDRRAVRRREAMQVGLAPPPVLIL